MNIRSHETDASCAAEVHDHAAVARVEAALPGHREMSSAASIFSALSDPTRLRICLALGVEELCVCDLAAIAGVSASGTSHQLRLLRDRGLVTFTRAGKRAVYRLADDHVRTLLAQGLEHATEGDEVR